jgi:hypothetical protein
MTMTIMTIRLRFVHRHSCRHISFSIRTTGILWNATTSFGGGDSAGVSVSVVETIATNYAYLLLIGVIRAAAGVIANSTSTSTSTCTSPPLASSSRLIRLVLRLRLTLMLIRQRTRPRTRTIARLLLRRQG